jgi:hypothetical protein
MVTQGLIIDGCLPPSITTLAKKSPLPLAILAMPLPAINPNGSITGSRLLIPGLDKANDIRNDQ